MNKKLFSLLGASLLCLTSCNGTGVHHEISEYVLKDINYTTNFKILQLTDLHMGDACDQDLQYKFIQKTIDLASPNMIVITGDVFTFASKSTIQRLFSFFDGQGIPWTLTWGNHDEQIYCSMDWMTGQLNNMYKSGTSNLYFYDHQDDDVFGYANFAINLKKDGKVFEQLIVMDSNRYHFGFDYNGYDYIHQDQIDWYKNLTTYTKSLEGGNDARTLMFYHIPLPEINNITKDMMDYGVKQEDCCPPKYNSGFFDVIKANRPQAAMFFGHDHVNDFRAVYEGITFCYGIKSTTSVYYDKELLGGLVITIKENHSLDYTPILHSYSEVI